MATFTKQQKLLLEEELQNFLDQYNLNIVTDYFYNVGIRPREKKENRYNGYHEDFLYDKKMDKIFNHDALFEFVNYLILQPHTRDMVIPFLISRQVSAKNTEYDEIIHKTLFFLKPHTELLFSFINRTKFLESNLKKLEECFIVIQDQQQREEIIDKCFSLKTFTSLNSQNLLYNLIQSSIVDKEKYNDFFPNIVNFHPDELLYEESIKEDSISYTLSIPKLNSVNLNKEYGTSELENKITSVLNFIHLNTLPSLNITKVRYFDDSGKPELNIIVLGPNLNKPLIDLFFNTLIQNKLQENHPYNNIIEHETLIEKSLKKANMLYLTTTLEEKLPNNSSYKKNKI